MKQSSVLEILLPKVTPSMALHAEYSQDVRRFRREFNELFAILPQDKIEIRNVQMVHSKLFDRKYLVIRMSSNWFEKTAPETDAIATDSFVFIDLLSPPAVLVPDFGPLPRSKKFRSILEHEFVHVNQSVLGRFPKCYGGSESDLFDQLMSHTICEYEANLIQMSYFDIPVPDEARNFLSVDHWCTLRGYTQALEALLRSFIYTEEESIGKNAFFGCLKSLSQELPTRFSEFGLSKDVGEKYSKNHPQFILTALFKLKELDAALSENDRFGDAVRWIEPQLNGQNTVFRPR